MPAPTEPEVSIRAELNAFLQNIADKHGITIKSIDADWIDVSTHADVKYLLGQVEMKTAAAPRSKVQVP